MAKNSYLQQADKMLKKQKLYSYFKDNNVLAVSEDKNENPFAFLIVEENQFPGIILSISVDCINTYQIADLTINLMHLAPVALGESFYLSANGNLYWNEEAVSYFELEYNPDLLEKFPVSNNNQH